MSASESFDEFVKRQQEHIAVDADFYDKQKQEWLFHLKELYDQAESYLKPYIGDGSIRLDAHPIELNEEGMGSYFAPKLTISIGSQQITLTPIGTMLIGSKGRVDVQGSRGKARLTLIDKKVSDARQLIKVTVNVVRPGQRLPNPGPTKQPRNIDWVWKIVSSPPNMAFIDLNKDSFLNMLQEVGSG